MSRTRIASFFILFVIFAHPSQANERLINGTVVPDGKFKYIVWITTGGSGCSASVVGKRTIITAAHCGSTGQTANFKIDGVSYSAKLTRHPDYDDSSVDHDLALGLTSQDIAVDERASISKTAPKIGDAVTLFGYGCTKPNGGVDYKLRTGDSVITKFRENDFGSHKDGGGATLCPGDSGGPGFVNVNNKPYLAGINSTVTLDYHTSYNERTDIASAHSFFNSWAQQNGQKICGVNEDCTGGTPPPPPTCTLAATPASIQKGQSITFKITPGGGELTSADIGGTAVTGPNWSVTTTPSNVGNFVQTAKVTGPGGSNTCSAPYEVKGDPTPTAPTCTLVASPSKIKVGDYTTVSISTQGQVTQALINGQSVSFPQGSLQVQGVTKGQQTASGFVGGPGGTGTCQTTFSVDDGTIQPIPPYAVVPSYCGQNTIDETPVAKACLGVIKRDGANGMREVVLVTYDDGTEEVLPIVAKTRTNPGVPEDALTLYANSSYKKDKYWILNSRAGRVTYSGVAPNEVPTSLEGRTIQGHYFVISQLQP